MSSRRSNLAIHLLQIESISSLVGRTVFRFDVGSVLSLPRSARFPGVGVALAGLMLSIGCSDDETITPPDPVEDPRKSIAGALQELKVAYEARDLDRYSALFNSDFVFVFDPTDVLENPDLPQNWDWSAEHNATRNMFEADLVERIQVDFIVGTPALPDTHDVGTREFPEGTMKVLVTEVELSVDSRDPAGGENIIYRCNGDQAMFFLYPDTLEVVDGVPAWKIFEWRDRRIEAVPTIGVTWGRIKAHYQ